MSNVEPLPGESRIGLVVTAVFLCIGAVGTVVGIFVPDILIGAVVILVISAAGFLYSLGARRNYLRDVRTGKVVVREPWSGPGAP